MVIGIIKCSRWNRLTLRTEGGAMLPSEFQLGTRLPGGTLLTVIFTSKDRGFVFHLWTYHPEKTPITDPSGNQQYSFQ